MKFWPSVKRMVLVCEVLAICEAHYEKGKEWDESGKSLTQIPQCVHLEWKEMAVLQGEPCSRG